MMLLAVHLEIGLADARRGAPVHVADVVAGLVGARLLEIQAAAEVHRARIARMALVHIVLLPAAVDERARLLDQPGDLVRREQGGDGGIRRGGGAGAG